MNHSSIAGIFLKTRPSSWLKSKYPIIVPISVHSRFTVGDRGELQLRALLSLLPKGIDRKVTVLICEGAHLNCLSLKWGDMSKAIELARKDASGLMEKCSNIFRGYDVLFWSELINQSNHYAISKSIIETLFQSDNAFKSLVNIDAKGIADKLFTDEYRNKELFVKHTELDLLEQCTYLLVISKLGYRFELYPGKRPMCLNYINDALLTKENRVTRVNVTVNFSAQAPQGSENIQSMIPNSLGKNPNGFWRVDSQKNMEDVMKSVQHNFKR